MPSLPSRSVSTTILPEDFVPNVNFVIIGRGKKHSKHSGNLRYTELVHEEMHAYAAAENKAGKSEVISRLVARVRQTGNFVREAGQSKPGRWSLVDEHAVRTTTAQHFRDALHSKYRSSKEMKKQKRKQDRRSGTIAEASGGSMMQIAAASFNDDIIVEPCKKRARCVSPESSDDESSSTGTTPTPTTTSALEAVIMMHQQQKQAKRQQVDYLSILSKVFLNKVDMKSNPFEPTPMRDTATTTHSLLGAFVDNFDSMPFFELDHDHEAEDSLLPVTSFKAI